MNNFARGLAPTSATPTTGTNKMRGGGPRTASRPTSQHGPQSLPSATPATRKIFNCIVDDTALVAGVKRSTRNGIRQWVKNGQIRLFVPLHALDQLSRQKGAQTKHGEDVRETLQWLDDVTTRFPQFVTLQGGDQYYDRWAEVEQFAVPRTLFSENDHFDHAESETQAPSVPDQDMGKLSLADDKGKSASSSVASAPSASPSSTKSMRSSLSQLSPPTSPVKPHASPIKADPDAPPAMATSSANGSIPQTLQPLFNYILWRIHQELDPIAALETFIFLCNDPAKSHFAKGFDIRSKRLEQLREAVGREDRDFRNRLSMQNRENQQVLSPPQPAKQPEPLDADDDEVVFKPPSRGSSAMTPQQAANVIDPNSFGRNPQATLTQNGAPPGIPQSPRFQKAQPMRGGPNLNFTPRGNNMRGNFRGGRGRGNFGPGRGGFAPQNRAPDAQQPGQIDPDSFARPRAGGFAGRGRLWVPT